MQVPLLIEILFAINSQWEMETVFSNALVLDLSATSQGRPYAKN